MEVDAIILGRPAFATHKVAHVERLADPVVRNAAERGRQAIGIEGTRTTIGVDVASETRSVLRVSNEEDALDGVKRCASQVRQSIGGGGCALRVPLEDKTVAGVTRSG